MRLPTPRPTRSPHDRTTCEEVLAVILATTPGVIDASDIQRIAAGSARLARYVRDTLALFTQLGQLEHVRRDLWIAEAPLSMSGDRIVDRIRRHDEEVLRAHVASRALGSWCVAAGSWALELDGALALGTTQELGGVRTCVSPRPTKPSTYGARHRAGVIGASSTAPTPARAASTAVIPPTGSAWSTRHVTLVRGEPVAVVGRAAIDGAEVSWASGRRLIAHHQDVEEAFLFLLEHPRLCGGIEAARRAVMPVLARRGPERLLLLGSRHPVTSVRRRLAFVLAEALDRMQGTTTWFGRDPDTLELDDEQWWRIQRRLRVPLDSAHPTPLEPDRRAVGAYDRRFATIDNRGATPLVRRPVRPLDGRASRVSAEIPGGGGIGQAPCAGPAETSGGRDGG